MKINKPTFETTFSEENGLQRELIDCPKATPFYWSAENERCCPNPFPMHLVGEDLMMRQKIYVRADVYPLAWIFWWVIIRTEKSWMLLSQFLILFLEIWGFAIAQPGEEVSWAWVTRKIKGGDRSNEQP